MWAHTEAMHLRAAAVEAHRRSADGLDRERYDLLLELATDAAYAGRWTQVEEAASEATGLGRALGSPALVGAAASTLSRYCVWIPHDIQVVMEDVVDDLRWALAHAAGRRSGHALPPAAVAGGRALLRRGVAPPSAAR